MCVAENVSSRLRLLYRNLTVEFNVRDRAVEAIRVFTKSVELVLRDTRSKPVEHAIIAVGDGAAWNVGRVRISAQICKHDIPFLVTRLAYASTSSALAVRLKTTMTGVSEEDMVVTRQVAIGTSR